jgi:cellulose synthase/poly-beta-1,6-N-acetylglucosamine synthase-like glycosyltransferase
VHVIEVDESQVAQRLDWSIEGLARSSPELSAKVLLARSQRNVLVAAVLVTLTSCVFDLVDSLIGILSIVTAIYVAVTVNRVVLFARAGHAQTVNAITEEEARAVPDDELPVYSVLVPAYREPEVIRRLLTKLDRLEYPRDKLDVKVILEADDLATIAAVQDAAPGDHVEVVLVPPAQPRTKPKALNYALGLCRGEVVTIYDAEDDPEPLQLRRAVIALYQAGPETVCVQAKLSFQNYDQNLITRWFTIEYAMWFSMFLPGLVSLDAPLPLGGTSNHFRREVLEELGAWDPYNVTEDADLGIRLARKGYRCGVLESVTLEEANSDFVNWVKQRSRWYKGYLQTSIVHSRHPLQLYRQLGWRGFTQVILFVLGTPLLAALNPFFWVLTLLWFSGHPHFIKDLFPAGLFYPSVLCWVLGNSVVAYLTLLTCRLMRRFELLWAALLVPLYWVMMAVAAIKAFWQLVATPSFWEKTVHGLVDLTEVDLTDHKDETVSATDVRPL